MKISKSETYSCLILVCVMLLTGHLFSQKNQFDISTKYPTEQLKQDIDELEHYIEKFHPDPYRYISKDSLHAFVQYQKNKIDSPLTEIQFRVLAKQIVARIGCGHTDIASSKPYVKAIEHVDRPMFPFNVFVNDSIQMFVLNNLSKDSIIKAGDEILSINGVTSKEVIKKVYSIFSSDGFNTTYKKQGTRYDWFKYYYGHCYGFKDEFLVKVKSIDGRFYERKMNAIMASKDTLLIPDKPHHDTISKIKYVSFWIDKNNPDVAVIDINSFNGKHWRKFFRETFKYIDEHQVKNLVIDLRDNGGGRIGKGLDVLSFIMDKSYCLAFDRPFNLRFFNPKIKMKFGERFTPLIFIVNPFQIIRHGRLRHFYHHRAKRRYNYNGSLYVLTNGKSFSMSCIAAAYLKYKSNAVIIGEETGGNIAGSNAVVGGTCYLPNTKVRLFMPMYHIYHLVDQENTNYGILPDYPIERTVQDVLQGKDPEMEKVNELIKSNQK